MASAGQLSQLYEAASDGRLSRRAFIRRAAALGMATPVLLAALQSGLTAVGAQPAAPTRAPAAGTANQRRGAGGELKIIQWMGPELLVPYNGQAAGSEYNAMGASFVLEPLMRYAPDGRLLPNLVKEIPSWQNGLLAVDNSSVTYNLLPGVTWSDGTPFTADDVVFTWQWLTSPNSQWSMIDTYGPISKVAALSPTQVKLTFKNPEPAWYLPFTGGWTGVIYPKHVLASGGADAFEKFSQKPLGTGPYVVESFSQMEQVSFTVNANYREPHKPFFAKITLKGGGDATSAERAVYLTGDWDFAPLLQAVPDSQKQAPLASHQGRLVAIPGASLEHLAFNFTDPNKKVNGEPSSLTAPNPVTTDTAVRQAISLVIPRDKVAAMYELGSRPAANVIVGMPAYASTHTAWEYDPAKAAQLLDRSGWRTIGGKGRAKHGVPLAVTVVTTHDNLRGQVLVLIRKQLEAIGFTFHGEEFEAGDFFTPPIDGQPNPLYLGEFRGDVALFATDNAVPYPLSYLKNWYAGPNDQNVPQQANQWQGLNVERYVNPAYDKLYEAVGQTIDPQKQAALFIQMNDLLVNDAAVIPLVQRSTDQYAVANKLRTANIAASPFEPVYWNIANWNRETEG